MVSGYAAQFSGNDFAKSATAFFETVREVLQIVVNQARDSPKHSGIPDALPVFEVLIQQVFEELNLDNLGPNFVMWYETMNEPDRIIAHMLSQEMSYYTILYRTPESSVERQYDIKDGLDDAKTIKDSFEKLIKRLPSKIRKVLSVLNEVLGLGKSII